ncbi:MAG: PSD1 and planctomycete cytochrome C domain-containing protein [Bythopirellula sp.]
MIKSPFLVAAALLLAVAIQTTVGFGNEQAAENQLEFFESQIRPVLIERCYECHNSSGTAEGGLSIDHRRGVLDGGNGGPIVLARQPEKSRLLAILRHEVDGLEMPQNGPKLAARTIADFEKWISLGLPDPRDQPPSPAALQATTSWEAQRERRKQWWSFQPIQRRPSPDVEGIHASEHPIDRFVAARLRESGLKPTSSADPAILVRRLYFNLIGLPPSNEDVLKWTTRIDDATATGRDAVIEALVDQLLNSPRFGERWARHWMDWIRYAESHGSEGDPPIDHAWVYRDYLIRALNSDVAYDQLVREHVAGDLLEAPRINSQLGINESAIGPAHWRMVFHGFAPTDALDETVRFIDDQINVFSKAFLGLTVACARCHDHKFDAISQRDYYALFGILASCRPGRIAIDLPEKQNQNREALGLLKPQIRSAIADDWLQVVPELRRQLMSKAGPWTKSDKPEHVLHPLFVVKRELTAGGSFETAWRECGQVLPSQAPLTEYDWRSNLASQHDYAAWFPNGRGLPERPFAAGEFSIATDAEAALIGIYPAGVYSHALSAKHPARLTSADFDIGEQCEVWLRVIGNGGASIRYVVHDYPRNGTVYPVADLKHRWKWQRFDLAYWNEESIHFELTTAKDAPLLVKDKPRSWFGIRDAVLLRKGQPQPTESHEHHRPLFEAAAMAAPDTYENLVALFRDTLTSAVEAWRDGQISDDQALLLDACIQQDLLPNQLASLHSAKALIEEYRRLEDQIPVSTRIPGLEEAATADHPLFERGNHKRPQELVPRRFLEAIDASPYATNGSGRRKLAEDLLRDDNPLTRRVIVNRLWHHLFGQGLVRTTNNFGRLGEKPSHPELLDWLATRMVDDDWSLKNIIRLIVTSKTWQLSSKPAQHALERDPDNQLLSRANVRRLEAEAIRDALLNAAGTLQHRLYGAPVGAHSDRRSIYVNVKRNSLVPFLRVFDFPEPFSSTGRRDTTIVPAQSLTLMNDPALSKYAASWAERLHLDAKLDSDEQRIEQMFMTAFGHPPSQAELSYVQDFLTGAADRYRQVQLKYSHLREELSSKTSARNKLLSKVREGMLPAAQPLDASDSATAEATAEADVIAAMSPSQRAAVHQLTGQVAQLEEDIAALGHAANLTDQQAAWRELARALFTFKEFIYVR